MSSLTLTAKTKRSTGFQLVLLIISIVLFVLVYYYNQAIADWWKLRNYTPSAAVSQLATDDTMTPAARHLFYINHPNLQGGTTFSTNCKNTSEKTIIFGCYHPVELGIYVQPVSDERLQGVEQVTSAHEMLHAAYDRLDNKTKQQVDGWLEDYYQHDLTDQRIKDTIDAYKQSEPDDVVNEMHSIFGTEVNNLPTNLENYYKRYFTNREAVVAYANHYKEAFISREQQIKDYDAQLANLKQTIEAEQASATSQHEALINRQQTLNQAKAGGDIATYNAGVAGYNQAVDTYNQTATKLKADITDYNNLVTARNALVVEEQHLVGEISGTDTQPVTNR